MPPRSHPFDEPEDLHLVEEMAAEAVRYVAAHDWCARVADAQWGDGVPGVVGVFSVHFDTTTDRSVDSPVWVIVGDLPPAFVVSDTANDSPHRALRTYCATMRRWVDAILAGTPLASCFPVAAEPSQEHAEMLASRLDFIERELLLIDAALTEAP